MREKKFSIIFPTRERPKLLDQLLSSICTTTACLDDVEVLIAYDKDDEATKQYIRRCGWKFPVWIECERSLNFSRDYYSKLAKMSRGQWLMIINDDTKFKTPDWDMKAGAVLSAYVGIGPNVVYGWVEDELGRNRLTEFNNYTCFPILGWEGVQALGFVFPERIPMWGADIWCRDLYGEVDRVVKVPITIAHICHHNKTREQDHVNKRVQANSHQATPAVMQPTYDEINKILQALESKNAA